MNTIRRPCCAARKRWRRPGVSPRRKPPTCACSRRWPDLPDSWYNLARFAAQRRPLRGGARVLPAGARSRRLARPRKSISIAASSIRTACGATTRPKRSCKPRSRSTPPTSRRSSISRICSRDFGNARRGTDDSTKGFWHRIPAVPRLWRATRRLKPLSGPDDPLIAQLQHGDCAIPARRPPIEPSLGFALGKALDACGAYDQAFAAYAAANRASRRSAGPARASTTGAQQERLVDELIRRFRPDPPRCDHCRLRTSVRCSSAGCFARARRSRSKCWPRIRALRPAASSIPALARANRARAVSGHMR